MTKKKSFREKLHDKKDFPRIEVLSGKAAAKWGDCTMVIPSPLDVDATMKKIPRGKVTTINEIRKTLAQKHGADIACPICTGIFARIAAGAADEEMAEGKKNITPFWRTLKGEGELNPKYPGGIEKQIELLEVEGHTIIPKGKKNLL